MMSKSSMNHLVCCHFPLLMRDTWNADSGTQAHLYSGPKVARQDYSVQKDVKKNSSNSRMILLKVFGIV